MPADPYLARGARVGIRPFSPRDEEEFIRRAAESAGLHRPWLFPPRTPAGFQDYLARLGQPSRAGFLVCELATDRIAGFININNIVRAAFQCGALGYGVFAHAAGRGYMSEGMELVLGQGFGPLGLHRLEANVQPGNKASINLVKRHGFRKEGYSPEYLHIDGAWRDHERWAITAEMFHSRQLRALAPDDASSPDAN